MDGLEQTKRYKKGFVLGKFLPPHQGHLYFIQTAMEQVEELTVLVCTINKESIPGIFRYQWMKQLLPGANVVHVTDEVPSYPHEDANFWEIWLPLLKREIDPGTEVFFSSEAYGDAVAEKLGIAHVLIDEARRHVPVSATAIRNNPFANWNFIPDPVKAYFVKRIVLTGPESTGKTILAKKLADHFHTNWVEEYGRTYFENKNGKLILEDMQHIAAGQMILEDDAATRANKLLFCDTDLMVTQIWSEIYFKKCPQWVLDKSVERKYDLYLLMDIDVPWVNDGTREFPHLRNWHFNRIKEELEKRGVKYVIISGNYGERYSNCISVINDYFFQALYT